MPAVADTLELLDQRASPADAAWNMALDEALLAMTGSAILRVYRWIRPTLSFGYFIPWESAAAVARDMATVRRWTGGGLVEHGPDFTWSFIVPWQLPVSRLRPLDSYEAIHGALAEALAETGLDATLAGKNIPAPAGGMCFAAPAPADLLLAGKKICGAGQRRCRYGLLHQGSICGVALPDDFPNLLASRLAKHVRTYGIGRLPSHAAGELVRLRYGTESWSRRR